MYQEPRAFRSWCSSWASAHRTRGARGGRTPRQRRGLSGGRKRAVRLGVGERWRPPIRRAERSQAQPQSPGDLRTRRFPPQVQGVRCRQLRTRPAAGEVHEVRSFIVFMHPCPVEVAMQDLPGQQLLRPRPKKIRLQGVRWLADLQPRQEQVLVQGVRRRWNLQPRQTQNRV